MLNTLILCMMLDCVTGFLAAAVFHKSKKTESGGLESHSGWKGLCRKGISLLVVMIAYHLDQIAKTSFICEAVMAAYLVNELVSIVENAGLMGVPIPNVIQRSIEVLKNKRNQMDHQTMGKLKSEKNGKEEERNEKMG